MSMTQATPADSPPPAAESKPNGGIIGLVLRLVALALLDAFAIWWIVQLVGDGVWFFTLTVLLITVGINWFYLADNMGPYRWFTPGLTLMMLLVLYPTSFTVYVAFTNYRDGNLLTQPQALELLMQRTYADEDAVTYEWTVYKNEAGDVLLWLVGDDDNTLIGRVGEPLVAPDESGFEFDGDGDSLPDAIGEYAQVPRLLAAADSTLSTLVFGEEPNVVQIPSNAGAARKLGPLYTYDEEANTLYDNQTETLYSAVEGTYTSDDGDQIRPGYYVPIGLRNFQRLFRTELFGGGEMVEVFIWTFVHAFLAVFVTFWVGLFLAITLNHPLVPMKKIFRSFILIPYAIPAFISVLVWRGLLEPNFGVINDMLQAMSFGLIDFVPWRSSAFFARTAIILIQMWLGFPYMLLITTGALQGIPQDMYEAAEVDGAGPLVKFWQLTLPLLLVAVGPLLIASFAFNFNNFTVIQLYLDGGPAISTTSVAGYTDILITYTYEVAFASGRGADFGFATAITIVIFVLLAVVTIFNFQLTRKLEEISENV